MLVKAVPKKFNLLFEEFTFWEANMILVALQGFKHRM